MRLVFSPINGAYFFLFGACPIRMGTAPLFINDRSHAVAEARACGLQVARNGEVSVIEKEHA